MTTDDKNSERTMENIVDQLAFKAKEQHSKNAIFFFFIFGFIIFLWKGEPLLSLKAALFFFVGMFLASFLSAISYFVTMQIAKRITGSQAGVLQYFFWIFDIGYDFVVALGLFHVYKLIF